MRFEHKVSLVGLLFFVVFVLVVLKLGYLQIFSFEKYRAAAENQHFYTLEIPSRRGEILAQDGFALASNKDDYLMYVNLSKFTDNKNLVAEKLSTLLVKQVPFVGTDSAMLKISTEALQSELLEKLTRQNVVWVNLYHFVRPEIKTEIENLNIPGLGFVEEQSRDYPEASMAAHLLGFVGFDLVGNPKGYFGLEGYYERELAGKPGEVRMEKDALGRPIAIGVETRREKLDGRNLRTTIDRSVQRFTQNALQEGIKTWQSLGGTAIVLNPKTGAVIAMTSYPQYDQKDFSYYSTKLYKNPAIADLYEPGSIMKPLVVAAALNENKITPLTRCDNCAGPVQIGEYYIHTFNDKYHPDLNIPEILINSDNTGMTFIGKKLGFSTLYRYFQNYGFSQKSGIDLQEEEEGQLRPRDSYREIDQATLTFGQGIAINEVQMIKAWTALANGGKMVTPYVVDKIEENGKLIEAGKHVSTQIFSPETAKIVTEMLVRVANESPVHFPLDRVPQLAKFRIAAKSGTAEIAVGGKYAKAGTTASVIGFFPADDPKFLVMVKLNEPEVRPWGSDTAGPVFASIVRDLIYYYGISP